MNQKEIAVAILKFRKITEKKFRTGSEHYRTRQKFYNKIYIPSKLKSKTTMTCSPKKKRKKWHLL